MVSHQLYLVSRNNNRLFFVVHHEGAFLCSQASCVIAHEIGKNITEQVILAESAICVTYSLPRKYQECTDKSSTRKSKIHLRVQVLVVSTTSLPFQGS